MAKVKGSRHYRLKVVPHRPIRNAFIAGLLVIAIILALVGTYWYSHHRTASKLISEDQAKELRTELANVTAEAQDLRQQVTKYQLNAEVDRQVTDEIRHQVVVQREQIAALERDVAVYRIMTSPKNSNPQGISFGVFSVTPVADDGSPANLQRIKLAIQKLAEGDTEFKGELQFMVVGQRGGKEEKIPLYQLEQVRRDLVPLTEVIPLQFKFFQNIEADVHIPDGFVPSRVELSVRSASKRKPIVIEGQLEWPSVQ